MRSLRLTFAPTAALLCAALALSGCGKPTQEQCDEFADHFVELLKESRERPSSRINKLADEQHDKIVEACIEDGSVEEVECVLAQKSIGDVEANCK